MAQTCRRIAGNRRQIQQKEPTRALTLSSLMRKTTERRNFIQDKPTGPWLMQDQFWARTPHVQNYNARYGILLDMVGSKDATFYYEGYSSNGTFRNEKRFGKRHMSWAMASIL